MYDYIIIIIVNGIEFNFNLHNRLNNYNIITIFKKNITNIILL